MATFVKTCLHEAHIYIISVSINRMLISIKKIFICKIYVSTLILHLFLISMLSDLYNDISNTRCAGDVVVRERLHNYLGSLWENKTIQDY